MFKCVGFLFNPDECLGCQTCVIACKNENQTPAHVHWRRVVEIAPEVILSVSCNQCDNPECFRVCPERAFIKRYDGIVMIDSDRCTGCMLCVPACPVLAPQFDPKTQKVTKCQMCYQRQDAGIPPACVEACTTGALKMIDVNLFEDDKTVNSIPGFPESQITKPSIRFYPIQPKKRYFLNN